MSVMSAPGSASSKETRARRGAFRRVLRAFSLIEVTIAGAILATGAAAVLGAYSTTMGVIEHQRRLAHAVNISQSRLEHLLSADSGSALLGGGSEVVDGLGRTAAPANDTYQVSWTVTPDVPAAGYLSIVVETSWAEGRGLRFTRFGAYREQ